MLPQESKIVSRRRVETAAQRDYVRSGATIMEDAEQA
jgi:hypothetical protein